MLKVKVQNTELRQMILDVLRATIINSILFKMNYEIKPQHL